MNILGLLIVCVQLLGVYSSCELVNYGCAGGMHTCPDEGKLDMYTSWEPTEWNKAGCASEKNAISFTIYVDDFHQQSMNIYGAQSGNYTISMSCNTGQKYYTSIKDPKNEDWDCDISFW